RTSRDSVRESTDDGSGYEIERGTRAGRTLAPPRSAKRLSAFSPRRARRADRIAAARVLENRRAARLHEPGESPSALLRRLGCCRLHSWRALPRARSARPAAGCRVLHARPGVNSACIHPAHELSLLPCLGEHGERAG